MQKKLGIKDKLISLASSYVATSCISNWLFEAVEDTCAIVGQKRIGCVAHHVCALLCTPTCVCSLDPLGFDPGMCSPKCS